MAERKRDTAGQDYYRRWVAVFAVFIVVMFQMGLFTTLGVFVPRFTEHFALSAGTVGLMASIGGGFRFVLGIGMGLPLVAQVIILNDYFKENMSISNGLAFSGGAIGMILFPPFMEYLIDMYGWRAALLLLGAICFNVCVAGALMKPPCSCYKPVPQKIAISPDRHRKASTFKETLNSYLILRVLAKEPLLVSYLAAFSLWSLANAGWVIFLVTYTITLGYSPQTASFLSSIGGVGTLIGRLMTGPVIDTGYMSGRTMLCVLSVGGSASLVLYPFVESYWALTIVSCLVGLFVGTASPVVILMLKELLPNDNII